MITSEPEYVIAIYPGQYSSEGLLKMLRDYGETHSIRIEKEYGSSLIKPALETSRRFYEGEFAIGSFLNSLKEKYEKENNVL